MTQIHFNKDKSKVLPTSRYHHHMILRCQQTRSTKHVRVTCIIPPGNSAFGGHSNLGFAHYLSFHSASHGQNALYFMSIVAAHASGLESKSFEVHIVYRKTWRNIDSLLYRTRKSGSMIISKPTTLLDGLHSHVHRRDTAP